MSYDLDKGAHSVYSLYYHFIQVVKYRRKVFINDELVDFLKTKVR
ncbi:MAG: transposase, partial [Candidatus Thermoplasmatota archaeon]|nr:transposase [Candidatus Thermoplasmatota archaeon]